MVFARLIGLKWGKESDSPSEAVRQVLGYGAAYLFCRMHRNQAAGLARFGDGCLRYLAPGRDDTVGFLTTLKEKAVRAGCDHIAVVWAEFGRHVESLVTEGRASSLLDIQVLAEFTARTKVIPITLGLLLHQELLQYAGNVPQSVRAEWRKIEGRFQGDSVHRRQ